ncbi:dephospho-CoA kinase [Hoeflea poritis]|uniref:Dephospho-CoA kinase n=1 Tax=Hoeflea poritis TaxID=2993659 RepID=A0ABT4VKV5_9HYPH|nr:dephospho-CoA kinase [Hoeflea poritis]MDA4845345.1 dephospho-CoA kinase [Hoeflea poritis]
MIVFGLTGSIGMGKSTAGEMFAERGIPVISADEIVHALYAGRAAPLIEAAFPGTVTDGVVDRTRLSEAVLGNEEAFRRLESIVHPLVAEERKRFVAGQREAGKPAVVLDIPLLFEGGGEKTVDKVVVVSCTPELQKERVMRRPGMTEEKFEAILARQVPDSEKRARADFVIDTSGTFDETRRQIDALIDGLIGGETNDA